MIVSIHQPDYLPWPGFFYKILQSDIFVVLDNVQFKKGGYQNRAKIKTGKGQQWLTIPVDIKGKWPLLIKDVEIANGEWTGMHEYKLKTYYPKSYEMIKNFCSTSGKLWASNLILISVLMSILKINKGKFIASHVVSDDIKDPTERLVNICQYCNADTYLSGPSGRKYLDLDMFKKAGIKVLYTEYDTPAYPQKYGDFIGSLSIIDMLENVGIEETKCLLESGGKINER